MQTFKRKDSPDDNPVWGHILNGKLVDDIYDPQVYADNETLESILGKNAFAVTSQLDQYELVKVKVSIVR
ncbi:hypothetical protein DSL64_25010 [Dyadobacter luteus]|jgi:hypothetical protein|uniref:Uncharacterized protein n=1 Tax=Dyadobacter luteus TaxID=2259619 RepID=A0A3D8Y4D0_9BACT|nr:hypothetical protein [Dyadobacter luteus]REA57076.1 hypothetical protein DSL64_25010 [Dyadobacter luteus]